MSRRFCSDISPRRRCSAVFVAALAALVLAGSILPVPKALARESAAAAMTLEQAARKVRREHGGRVVSAGVASKQGREGYRIRVLTKDGRVHTFWIDARSGAMRPSR